MDKVFEAIFVLLNNPFTDFFQWIGFSENASKALSAVLAALLVWQTVFWLKRLQLRWKDIKTAKELVHFRYNYKDVKQKRDLFIPTQAQSHSPTYEDEPKHGIKFIPKVPLIPFFIKNAFNEKRESDKFYLVLADSGMGKTTFMINLYLQYHSFFNFRRKFKMKLFPFGDKDIVKWIKEIKSEEAHDTILLLDAFDEYKALLPPKDGDGLTDDERFQKLLDEIIESVKDFREVVITSRTQYFPGQEDKPYELKIPRYGREGFHTLAKLYLSPFDEKEIKRYLNKKYGVLKWWNRKKKRTAATVVKSSPKLMVRPMLLSYIDYLVDSQRKFTHTFQIYDTLIQKWIEREAGKRKHKSEDREKFKRDLYAYSRLLALEIYNERKPNYLLSKEEAITICRKYNIDLYDYEITGQSLLTRDASQNWKFAHKSILEFFWAKEAVERIEFYTELVKSNFAGMDMGKLFLEEVGNWIYVKGGMFQMGDEKGDLGHDCYPVHQVTISDFYIGKTLVTQKQWLEIMGNNPSNFTDCDDCPVENVSWNDAQAFIDGLNAKTGMKFRLPTEAEWEYAAGGGHKFTVQTVIVDAPISKGKITVDLASKYQYAGSNNLDEVGWYNKNSNGKTHPVAAKRPNELGLYDMSGNVYEWCQDWYSGKYYEECKNNDAVENPTGPGAGSYRVVRGGSWSSYARFCRSTFRNRGSPDSRDNDLGFRLVFVP